VSGASWKEKLYILEGVEARTATLAAGSYQNIFTANGYSEHMYFMMTILSFTSYKHFSSPFQIAILKPFIYYTIAAL